MPFSKNVIFQKYPRFESAWSIMALTSARPENIQFGSSQHHDWAVHAPKTVACKASGTSSSKRAM